MSKLEHLKIIKKGVRVWNKWREENPTIIPELSGANLSDMSLDGANFSNANLRRAYFDGANLEYSKFINADLTHSTIENGWLLAANLSGANLSGASLVRANLFAATLVGANLFNVTFWITNLCRADLTGANLKAAILGYVMFGDTNLTNTKGLEFCQHGAPSYIDSDTLSKSGELPLSFLRGCGLPDTFIEYVPSLINKPIHFYSCFISYSSKNQLFADRLYADLQNKGVRCWLATEDLKIGVKTRIAIDESIRFHDKLLLVLSKHSVASTWVEQEVETALARERRESRTVLFPIRLDDTVTKINAGWPALIKNTRNIGDFRKWRNPESYSKAFDRLLRDLKASE